MRLWTVTLLWGEGGKGCKKNWRGIWDEWKEVDREGHGRTFLQRERKRRQHGERRVVNGMGKGVAGFPILAMRVQEKAPILASRCRL